MRRFVFQLAWLLAFGCGDSDDGNTPDTGPETSTSGVPATLVQGGAVACANPTARTMAEYQRKTSPAPMNSEIWLWGGGSVVADFNGNGFLEVVLTHETAVADVFTTDNGADFEIRTDVLAAYDLSFGTGGSTADYDADGDLDLYLTRYDRANLLLRNDGDLVFTDVTDEAGVNACHGDDCYRSMSTAWGDIDRDGDLDLLVGNYGEVDHSGTPASAFGPAEPSFLYLNNGDGTFTDATEAMMPWNEVHDGYTYVSPILDLDNDLWPEIYFINDFGTAYPNRLVKNVGGTLTLDRGVSGMDLPMTGMGLGVGDLNGDTRPDLLIPEWNSIRILESQADFDIWADVGTAAIGFNLKYGQKVPWGGELADMDLDGDLDAIIAYGFVASTNEVWNNAFQQPDSLYLRQADGTFSEAAHLWNVADDGVGRGFVACDLNRDGYLDLAKRDLAGPELLFLSNCGDGNWVMIDLRMPGTGNTHAIGAVVDIEATGLKQRRWVMGGGLNYNSSTPPEVHFGLGISDVVERITVTWPDGTYSEFTDVPARQRLTITRD